MNAITREDDAVTNDDDAYSVEREVTANQAIAGAEAAGCVVATHIRAVLDAWVRGTVDDDRLVKALVLAASERKAERHDVAEREAAGASMREPFREIRSHAAPATG